MHKPSLLSLAACLALTACEGSKQKTTWEKVTETRPDKIAKSGDPSESYSKKLHQVLKAEKVEHKVVTYQYRYKTRMRDDAVGTHSAVIYRDNTNPDNPWWLMDDRLGKPIWVPGEDVNKQVAFYLRRNAEVLEQKEFSGGEPEITGIQIAKKTPVVPEGEPSVTRIAKVRKAPARENAMAQTRTAAPQPEASPFVRPARFGPAAQEVEIPFTAPSPADAGYDDIFRRAHGTDYDPSSPVDRRKMETIKHARLDTAEPAATRTF